MLTFAVSYRVATCFGVYILCENIETCRTEKRTWKALVRIKGNY